MSDEKNTEGVEELDTAAEQVIDDTAVVEEAAEEVADEAPAEVADETVAEVAEEQETVTQALDEADEKVEAAVRHVAEEAEAELKEAEEEAERTPRERRSKQARAEKEAKRGFEEPVAAPAKASLLSRLGTGAWLGISAACLVAGLLLGHFVIGGSASGADFAGKTTVAEAELDNTLATYTLNGQSHTLSVREVMESAGTLDDFLSEDGTYKLPSSETAVNAARTAILNSEVESRGIEVSADEVAAYAEQNLGTSDFEAIGQTYGMDAAAVEKLITDNCRINALREQVIGTDLPVAPEAPATAEEGKEDEVTKEYADYIIALAGDEWDAEKGAWVDEASPYATALDGADFSKDGASYNAAISAYYVAYQVYNEQSATLSQQWTDFLNGLLSSASIQVGTLVS
jgi:hypothetical protein